MGYGYMMDFSYGWILWIAVIVVMVYAVVQVSKTGTPGGGQQEKPLDILKRRYAKGEINKEVFDRMKKDLE